MQTALVIALRARRVDVLTASDCAMVGRSDEDHLRYDTSLEGSFQERRSRESAKLRTYGEETASRI